MSEPLTIGRLAKAAGVPVSTVRYYERRGLLRAAARTGARYRLFGREALDRLLLIREAQRCGFRLDDVAEILRVRDGERPPCARVQGLIEDRLDDLDAQLRELRRFRQMLSGLLRRCREGEPTGRCRVIESLDAPAGSRRRKTS